MKYSLFVKKPAHPSALGKYHDIYADRVFGIRLRLALLAQIRLNSAPWWRRKLIIERDLENALPEDLFWWHFLHKKDREVFVRFGIKDYS